MGAENVTVNLRRSHFVDASFRDNCILSQSGQKGPFLDFGPF